MPPPYVAFGGAGASLGVAGGGRAAPAAGAVVRPGAAPVPVIAAVDPAQPVTTLQVKLLDGRKERLQLNLGHTVADLQAHVLRCENRTALAALPSRILLRTLPAPPSRHAAALEAAGAVPLFSLQGSPLRPSATLPRQSRQQASKAPQSRSRQRRSRAVRRGQTRALVGHKLA